MKIYNNSELIYQGWLNTDKPLIYETKLEKKEINFADPIKNKNFDKDYVGVCNLCGNQIIDGGVPIKKFFSNNYMDWALHKHPEGTHICKACTFCLGMNTQGRITLFRYPIVATINKLYLCSKYQFREFLLNRPDPPFLIILPVSQQKHLFHKSSISYDKNYFYCNYEENTIPCTANIENIIFTIEKLRFAGISTENIKKGILPGNVIKTYSLEKQLELLYEMDSIRFLPTYDLVAKVSLSKTDMEERGIKYDL